MVKLSAGLLVHRAGASTEIEVLLVHPGGPFWANKDEHAWSIPKGEHEPGDDAEATARREFAEELGQAVPPGELVALGEFKQNSSKTVSVWALGGDVDVSRVESNTFEMEWPPKSGTMARFPEVDRAEWFAADVARTKIHKGQVQILDALIDYLT